MSFIWKGGKVEPEPNKKNEETAQRQAWMNDPSLLPKKPPKKFADQKE